jgi:RNA-directed DNA polymerase
MTRRVVFLSTSRTRNCTTVLGLGGGSRSARRVQRICASISEETRRNKTTLDAKVVVRKLNQRLNGWANYFCLGPVSKAYRAVDQHTRKRLRQWLCHKHKVKWPGKQKFPTASFYQVLGLVSLTERTASFPWAKP